MNHDQELLYLSRADVESLELPMSAIVGAVTGALEELGHGQAEMPPKPGIHTRPDSFIHAMPAYLPGRKVAGMKWISGYPANSGRDLPYITGLLILNDEETGVPQCVMDATWITAMRTGAATAVAARFLARPESTTLGLLGCGVQGRSNLEALRVVLPSLDTVRAYDISPKAVRAYEAWARENFDVRIVAVSSPKEALEGADVVVTAGPILAAPEPQIQDSWLEPGTFCCTLDFDSYVRGDAMRQADRLLTDDLAQLEHYRQAGYFQDTPPVRQDLGMLVTGKVPGRSSASERILCLNLGLAVEDMATASLALARARELGIGTRLAL